MTDKQMIKMKSLVNTLNLHRDLYYNKQSPIISDKKYDDMFDELLKLEKETLTTYANSPTVQVGYEVKSNLNKVKHNHPMLSLDKTKDVEELIKFYSPYNDQNILLMAKMDGLTISLVYENGILISAETRGNGEIGEDVLHNVKTIENLPLSIPFKGRFVIDGEAIINIKDFNDINNNLPEEQKFKNPRNLVSGSIRQLNSEIASKRHIRFIAWKLVESPIKENSFLKRLNLLDEIGFETVTRLGINNAERNDVNIMKGHINSLRFVCNIEDYPIDGLVCSFDDVPFSESLGMTSHHVKSQLAFKFYDEAVTSIIRKIDWTMGKSGILTPTAVFDEVEISGSMVSRASLHNVSIMNELDLSEGDEIEIIKANDIIPQITNNLTRNPDINKKFLVPYYCPCCGSKVIVRRSEGDTINAYCDNPNCNGKLLARLSHFVGKEGLDIQGMSDATLTKLIDEGIVSNFSDIFRLNEHIEEIEKLDKFGKKSIEKLLSQIEKSRHTTLDRLICALSIPMIGKTVSKTIAKYCSNDIDKFEKMLLDKGFDWTQLDDFGSTMNDVIVNNSEYIISEINSLKPYIVLENNNKNTSNKLNGLVFVITGSLENFSNREEAVSKIENLGGKVSGSVSNKTNYLVNNDINSTSSKNQKAKSLGVPIITEKELIDLLNN